MCEKNDKWEVNVWDGCETHVSVHYSERGGSENKNYYKGR